MEDDKIIDEKTAINILVQGIELGMKAGAYSMGDARYIIKAVEFLDLNYFNPPAIPEEPEKR